LDLKDFLVELSEKLGFQMMNTNFEMQEHPEVFNEYKQKTSIVKFNPKNLKFDYNNWFGEDEKENTNIKVPIPSVNLEKIIYTDYGKFDDDKEKIELEKKEVGDIFKRDGTNYVKDDIIMNILRKMNK
jgi:hypothetical protein